MAAKKKVKNYGDSENSSTAPPKTICQSFQSVSHVILKKHMKGSTYCESQIQLIINHAYAYRPKSP